MRMADLLVLPLAALWQQKARTALTTLGVVFARFVLAASLSINQRVQDTIQLESHRTDSLRLITIHPDWSTPEADLNIDQVDISGEMDDARRKRLRKALAARKAEYRTRRSPRTPLTAETLQT